MKWLKIILLGAFSFAIPVAFFTKGGVIQDQEKQLYNKNIARVQDSAKYALQKLKDSLLAIKANAISNSIAQQNKALLNHLKSERTSFTTSPDTPCPV